MNSNKESKFYPIEEEFDGITKHEQHFLCIDWEEVDLELYGRSATTFDFQNLDIILVPCQLLLPDIGFTEDAIPNDCLADQQDRTRSCPVAFRCGRLP